MRKTIRRKHEAHRRAQAICERYRGVIEAHEGGKNAFTRFNAEIGDVDQLLAAQRQALNDRRVAQEGLTTIRRTLRDICKAVMDVSALVTLDEGSAKLMQIPSDGPDELLQADATAIYSVASAHADRFERAGLLPHVIPDLNDQIQAFATFRKATSTARKAYAAATRATVSTLGATNRSLKVMDGILAHARDVDPQAVSMLRSAKRIGYDHSPSEPPAAKADPVPTDPIKAAS